MSKLKKYLFLTTANLGSNPRLVKELSLVVEQGHYAIVYMFKLGNWSDILTKKIKIKFPSVEFKELSATRNPFLPWFISSILENIIRYLPICMLNENMLSLACSKRSYFLRAALKIEKTKYDWIIAHNPGAFFPAKEFALKHQVKLGIDIEDFHPGETTDAKMQCISRTLMSKVLPNSNYCSYASELIKEETLKTIQNLNNKHFVINNSFPESEFVKPTHILSSTIKLIWFSQNITFGRGLDFYISTTDSFYPSFELHLYGQIDNKFYDEVIKDKKGIILHGVLDQSLLHFSLSKYDVGLSIDLPINLNRQIALTNKIIAYKQAGLFILASNTLSHSKFLEKYNNEYLILNSDEIISGFTYLEKNISQIREKRLIRFNNAKKICWEKENITLKDTLEI